MRTVVHRALVTSAIPDRWYASQEPVYWSVLCIKASHSTVVFISFLWQRAKSKPAASIGRMISLEKVGVAGIEVQTRHASPSYSEREIDQMW